MACDVPAPPTKTACTWGRRAVYQGKAGAWPVSVKWKTEGARTREEGGEEQTGKEIEEHEEEEQGKEEEDSETSTNQ